MVICLERGADLHMAQLIPLPLTLSCFSKIQIGLPFWYWLTWVVPDKGPLNECVCACVTAAQNTQSARQTIDYNWRYQGRKLHLQIHIGNESVPKVIINDTVNLFSKTAISILLISNHDSFRVPFDKIASVYFIWQLYLYFVLEMAIPGNWHCQLYQHTLVPYSDAAQM